MNIQHQTLIDRIEATECHKELLEALDEHDLYCLECNKKPVVELPTERPLTGIIEIQHRDTARKKQEVNNKNI